MNIKTGRRQKLQNKKGWLRFQTSHNHIICSKIISLQPYETFFRHKLFSAINVLGLTIGISSALVIFLIVYYEFSFDTFEKDRDRIYRVVLDAKFGGNEGHSAAVPAPLGSAIQNEVTGVEKTIPIFQFQGNATAKVSITKHICCSTID